MNKPNKFELMNSPLVIKAPAQRRTRRKQRAPRQKKKAGKTTVIQLAARKPRARRTRKRRVGLNGNGVNGIGNTRGQSSNKNSMLISESEYVGQVTTPQNPAFNVTSYAINPGNSALFPWLSTIAQRFEKYTFTHLRFEYKKEVTDYAAAGQTGKVIMSVDYDAADPAPTSKQMMEATIPHADAMPSQTFGLSCGAGDLRKSIAKFVRSGAIPGGTDIKTYDVGKFFIATQGILGLTATSDIGELHVHYTIRFDKPVLEADAAPENNSVTILTSNDNPVAVGEDQLFINYSAPSINGLQIGTPVGGHFSLPAGNYLFDAAANGIAQTAEENLTSLAISLLKNDVVAVSQFCGLNTTSTTMDIIQGGYPWFFSCSSQDDFSVRFNITGTGEDIVAGLILRITAI
jgi:hypothetical protein